MVYPTYKKFRTLSSSQNNTILVIGVIIFVLLLLVIITTTIIIITKACNLEKCDGSWLYHGWSVHATGHRQGAQGGAWRCVCFFVLSRFEVMWSSHQDHVCFWWILQNRSNANMIRLHHQVFPGCQWLSSLVSYHWVFMRLKIPRIFVCLLCIMVVACVLWPPRRRVSMPTTP